MEKEENQNNTNINQKSEGENVKPEEDLNTENKQNVFWILVYRTI